MTNFMALSVGQAKLFLFVSAAVRFVIKLFFAVQNVNCAHITVIVIFLKGLSGPVSKYKY